MSKFDHDRVYDITRRRPGRPDERLVRVYSKRTGPTTRIKLTAPLSSASAYLTIKDGTDTGLPFVHFDGAPGAGLEAGILRTILCVETDPRLLSSSTEYILGEVDPIQEELERYFRDLIEDEDSLLDAHPQAFEWQYARVPRWLFQRLFAELNDLAKKHPGLARHLWTSYDADREANRVMAGVELVFDRTDVAHPTPRYNDRDHPAISALYEFTEWWPPFLEIYY